ncbi:MAG: ROK family protein [Vibrio sp.]
MKNQYYVVFDIGGSAVKTALMDHTSRIFHKQSLPTSHANFSELVACFDAVIHDYAQRYELSGVAISSCGAVDCDTGIIHGSSALDYIHGPNFKNWCLQTHHLPCEIENDACCAALAEVWKGEARDVQDCCSVVIGSGVGGSVIYQRQIHHGHHLHAGEFGYMVVASDKGQVHTLSDLASTRGLIESAATVLGLQAQDLTGFEVFEHAEDNQAVAQVVDDWYHYLAIAMYNIQYCFDPQKIIIGGAISHRDDLIFQIDCYIDKLMQKLPHAKVRPQISRCQLGNDANLVGALYHFIQQQGI